MQNLRVVVVGTTPDYIDLIRTRHPGRAYFLTDRGIRERAFEPAPGPLEEVLWDLADEEGAVEALVKALSDEGIPASGVACYDCESLPLACRVAKRLGLPYHDREAIETSRNKWLTKAAWRDAGVPCPGFEPLTSRAELEKALGNLGLPLVLKPLTGAGSELVFKVSDPREAAHCLDLVKKSLASHADERLYPQLSGSNSPSPRDAVLCEEFAEGEEFSCDFLLGQGRVRLIRVARKIPAAELGTGTAMAYVVPAMEETGLDPAWFAGLLGKAARSLGFTEGVFMADFIMTPKGPVFLELTPRPSGDCLPWLIEAASGLDMLGLALDLAAAKPVEVPNFKDFKHMAGVRLFAPKEGTVCSFDTRELEGDPRVQGVRLYRQPGHRVVLPPADYASRVLGHAIFAPTPGVGLVAECRELASKFHPVYEA